MSDTAPPLPLARAAFADVEQEFSKTRRILERLPAEHLAWTPHERSMTLGGLALHVANLAAWQIAMLREEEYDLAAAPPPLSQPEGTAEILERFDRSSAAVLAALGEMGEEALMAPWTLRRGDVVMMTMPRAIAVRSLGISHLVHHRGQLSVYLRMLDVPVPGMYGPSADEKAG